MPQKNLEVTLLLDYYGGMLTDKQREVVDLYYNEDLSLAEISEHAGITRQGVRDSIKRGETQLLDMEQRLGLVARMRAMEQSLEEIAILTGELEQFASANISVRPVLELTDQIKASIARLQGSESYLFP